MVATCAHRFASSVKTEPRTFAPAWHWSGDAELRTFNHSILASAAPSETRSVCLGSDMGCQHFFKVFLGNCTHNPVHDLTILEQ